MAASCGDGLDDAGFVVGEHDGDEFCVGAEGLLWRDSGVDEALGGWGPRKVTSAPRLARAWAAWRTAWCSMEVVMRWGFSVRLEDAEEGEVVAFGASGGEDDLGGAAVEEVGYGFAGAVDGGAGLLALLVDGTGIAEVLDPVGVHGFDDLGEEGSRGVGVHVDTRRHALILLGLAGVGERMEVWASPKILLCMFCGDL